MHANMNLTGNNETLYIVTAAQLHIIPAVLLVKFQVRIWSSPLDISIANMDN